jgi:hypothetical protein
MTNLHLASGQNNPQSAGNSISKKKVSEHSSASEDYPKIVPSCRQERHTFLALTGVIQIKTRLIKPRAYRTLQFELPQIT